MSCTPIVRLYRLLVVAVSSLALNAPYAVAQTIELPSLGDAGSEELSPATERKLGEQIMFEVRREATYLPETETSEYLNSLGY